MTDQLLIGCGNKRAKILHPMGDSLWGNLTTLDNDPNCGADVEHDLMRLPLPFADERFDEIHAYHVLEHTGAQGDFRWFFAQWEDFYRLLKPGGLFCAAVPAAGSPWVFGDPGHTRFIPSEVLTFLDQTEYTKQVGVTALADYRRFYRADFEKVFEQIMLAPQDDAHPERQPGPDQFFFILKAVKPSRISL